MTSHGFPHSEDMVIDLTIGVDATSFCPELDLFLSPLSRIEITIKLPKFTIPGQSISNWDLMERLKKGVAPIQVILLIELSITTIKYALVCFNPRHDWDLFFMKNQLNENKVGERPDTIYLAKVPIKWFSKGSDLPSEDILKTAMESFGNVRRVDIPACDALRKEMDPEISGIKTKGFAFGPELFFEAYVQYMEYSGFSEAMDALRNKKWTKRIDGKVFHANVKVGSATLLELLQCEAERLRKEAERLKQLEEERLLKEAVEALRRAREARTAESKRFLELMFEHIQVIFLVGVSTRVFFIVA
ncbi:unnamed protein product [Haemonchus placei]|uniref:TAP-C domain-containing protein n=1 Tax=Haemonchus placei TaxID=6290 RepID=A0A0N4W522_HAEPC|nr:unnamed protein product [Haemonchus placei]